MYKTASYLYPWYPNIFGWGRGERWLHDPNYIIWTTKYIIGESWYQGLKMTLWPCLELIAVWRWIAGRSRLVGTFPYALNHLHIGTLVDLRRERPEVDCTFRCIYSSTLVVTTPFVLRHHGAAWIAVACSVVVL